MDNINYIDDDVISYTDERFIICYSLKKVSDYYWINNNVYTETFDLNSDTKIVINDRSISLQICPTTNQSLSEIRKTIRQYLLNKLLSS